MAKLGKVKAAQIADNLAINSVLYGEFIASGKVLRHSEEPSDPEMSEIVLDEHERMD